MTFRGCGWTGYSLMRTTLLNFLWRGAFFFRLSLQQMWTFPNVDLSNCVRRQCLALNGYDTTVGEEAVGF